MTHLVTGAAYAKLRGISKQAVAKAIKAGRISTVEQNGKRLVDVDAANASWAARTDNAQQQRGAIGQVENTQRLARGSAPAKPASKTVELHGGLSLIEEKTRSERLRVERQEMDLAERRGETLNRAAAVAAWDAKLMVAAEQLQGLADRLAAPLAAERDPAAVHRVLSTEIAAAMAGLAGATPN